MCVPDMLFARRQFATSHPVPPSTKPHHIREEPSRIIGAP
jgi:hypothetical protein